MNVCSFTVLSSFSTNSNSHQSAYRKHFSTETALLHVTDGLQEICATGHAAALDTLDLSAAFDTIDHDILIDPLKIYSHISDLALSWFCSYLAERKPFVKIGSLFSATTTFNPGVSQGSLLDPLFFSFYTSLIIKIILQHDQSFHQFADDIGLFIEVPFDNPNSSLDTQSDCFSISINWFFQNHSKLNPSKSEYMFVGSPALLFKSNLPSVTTLDSTTLTISSKITLFGVSLDSNINFSHFISRTIQTSNFHTQAIKQLHKIRFLPTAATLSLNSHLEIELLQLPSLWSSSLRPF